MPTATRGTYVISMLIPLIVLGGNHLTFQASVTVSDPAGRHCYGEAVAVPKAFRSVKLAVGGGGML